MALTREQRKLEQVSIQLVSPASGDFSSNCTIGSRSGLVSIQLVSPASGDGSGKSVLEMALLEFPFNWYPQRVGILPGTKWRPSQGASFHSIGIPSEWGFEISINEYGLPEAFPFNWYPQRVGI